jgi:hypothetical protein
VSEERSDQAAPDDDSVAYFYRHMDYAERPCPDCGGRGQITLLVTTRPCIKCEGSGTILELKEMPPVDLHDGPGDGSESMLTIVCCDADGNEIAELPPASSDEGRSDGASADGGVQYYLAADPPDISVGLESVDDQADAWRITRYEKEPKNDDADPSTEANDSWAPPLLRPRFITKTGTARRA